MAFCRSCGQQIPDNMRFCGFCGAPTGVAQAAPAPYVPPQGAAAPVYAAPARYGGSPAKSIVGMCLSITALILVLIGTKFVGDLPDSARSFVRANEDLFAIPMVLLSLGVCFGIPGLIVSCKGRRNARGRRMGTAGMILGIIALSAALIAFAVTGVKMA